MVGGKVPRLSRAPCGDGPVKARACFLVRSRATEQRDIGPDYSSASSDSGKICPPSRMIVCPVM